MRLSMINVIEEIGKTDRNLIKCFHCFLINMRTIFSALSIFCVLGKVSVADEILMLREPSCFQFTWLGPEYDKNATSHFNCSSVKNTPCIEPFVVTDDSTPPNITYMWYNEDQDTISCPMRSVCVKYTYIYKEAIQNMSYFCGKMTEDEGVPLTSGCYTQKVGGYTIEACACETYGLGIPCNSSMSLKFSIPVLIIVMTFLKDSKCW